MTDTKKFFWLKLKYNFFEEKYIKALKKMPGGTDMIIVYLKMQLKSLKTEGILRYDQIMPSHEEELALILDEEVNVVRATIMALERMKVIEIWDNETIYMTCMQELIGSETSSAARVRKHREEKKLLQCNDPVTKSNTEKEKEKEKRKTYKEIFEAYASGELLEVLFEFAEMRKSIKAKLTDKAATMLLNELDKLAHDDMTKIQILDQSIFNNWKSVYPLKNTIKAIETMEEIVIDENGGMMDGWYK